jgi:hypothetical protein
MGPSEIATARRLEDPERRFEQIAMIDKELIDRAEAIHKRIVQLRDSL